MYAECAAKLISAMAKGIGIDAVYLFGGNYLDCFKVLDVGTHKYIPADALTQQLGLPQSGGVFGYVRFEDNSYALKLCSGKLAYWSGNDGDLPVMV